MAFQAMRYYAGKIGLAFSELPGEDVETIPDDLQDLHDQALRQIDHLLAGGTATSLVAYISPALGAKYVHNSAFWDEAPDDLVVDETGIIDDATFNLLLINRPQEGMSVANSMRMAVSILIQPDDWRTVPQVRYD